MNLPLNKCSDINCSVNFNSKVTETSWLQYILENLQTIEESLKKKGIDGDLKTKLLKVAELIEENSSQIDGEITADSGTLQKFIDGEGIIYLRGIDLIILPTIFDSTNHFIRNILFFILTSI